MHPSADETTEHALLTDAVHTWGTHAQLVMALEEMAELSKEVAKTIRTGTPTENLADEIADVEIMLAQLRIIATELGHAEFARAVAERKAFKLGRIRQRLRDWKATHSAGGAL